MEDGVKGVESGVAVHVAWYTETVIFGCMDLTLRTSVGVRVSLDVYTVFASVKNFHCQTYPRPEDQGSNNCLFPDFPVPGEF